MAISDLEDRLPEAVRSAFDVGRDATTRIREHRTSVIAGGVAFFLLLALVPAMIAAVSLFGLAVSPADVQSALEPATDVLPEDAANLVTDQLSRVSESGRTSLTVGVVLAVGLALWAMSSGVKALIGAVNLAHETGEQRSFLRLRGLALLLALLALAGLAVFVVLEVVTVGLGGAVRTVYTLVRFLAFAFVAFAWLAVLYEAAPHGRTRDQWRLISGGALVAVVLAALAVIGFTIYVRNFGSYNETYGTLGAVIVLMLLLYVVALAIVVGAEVDAVLDERHERAKRQPRDAGV